MMHDLIIIGSGPAGLSAAVYGVRAGLDVLVVEQNAMSGGQILNTYEVDNYLGFPGINGFDLGMRFREHADALGVVFLEAQVLSVEDAEGQIVVNTRKEQLQTRALLLATGARHAKLGVEGEDQFVGHGVSYCATCDGAFYKKRTVAVVGGGDVALEDAIYLAEICEKVYLIHRRDAFRGAAILQERLKNLPNVEILYHQVVETINGSDKVETLTLEDVQTKTRRQLPVQGVFIAVGIQPETDLLKGIVTQDEKGYVLAGEDGCTDRAGFFAAGDVRSKPLRQVVTAVADGANAAISAAAYCRSQRSDA